MQACRWVLFLRRLFLTAAVLANCCNEAADLSTTGVENLRPFITRTERLARPITILSFGDSMADSYRSITCVLMHRFVDRLGVSGHSLDAFADGNYWRLTNGAVAVGPDSFWFMTHHQLPPGGGIWWDSYPSALGIWSDTAGFFFVANPNGGDVTLSISTNAGPWGPLLSLNTYAPSPVGCFTNIVLAADFHRLRIDAQTGTNIIIGSQLLDSTSSGVHAVFVDEPGISLGDVTNVPLAIRLPVLKVLSPDLLIWHMKEDGSEDTHVRLIECEQWWSNAAPDCSIIYIGTPWVSIDNSTTYTIDQNTLVRSVALDFQHAYADCMNPAVSYDWMVNMGYMTDVTHENLMGNTYLANFPWNELGFFAIGTPRKLDIELTTNGVNLKYQTWTNILYTIESSDDLVHWQSVSSQPGDGSIVITNFPSNDLEKSFRLRLNPNN